MVFLSRPHTFQPKRPLFVGILANTMLSTVPGLSGAGPNPKGSLLVPILDAELIWQGAITSSDATPNTPTGCPTPASITRAVLELTHVSPLFINAGLAHRPTVAVFDLNTKAGEDPRSGPAVPDACRPRRRPGRPWRCGGDRPRRGLPRRARRSCSGSAMR